MRRAALCALLGALVLVALVLVASPARAHTRSQSFSTWDVRAGDVAGVFQVSAVEATRLAAAAGAAADLGALLRAHLAATVTLARGGAPCAASAPPRSLAARQGALRVELRFACAPGGPLALRDGAFFDLASSHVHTARLRIDDAPAFELLFTDARREQSVEVPAGAAPTEASAPGAAFASYVVLGVQHIAAGADHVAFLVALLLLCRRLRDVAWLVTGFTLGHSLTLSLAVLGVVRPNVPVVEALIGFTIALVAAENVAVRARGGRHALAAAAAAVLLALALVRAGFGVGLPVATSAGLALFAFAYLPLAADEAEARRTRPVVTLLFGLVHGFGFASVLLEVGLPAGRIASALFGFNLGVELGQLAIVALLWAGGLALAPRRGDGGDARAPRVVLDALSALLCGLGLFWFVERALGA
jgi:hypothetical protein